VFHKGILVLIIGMLSIVFAIAYTAGPFPLAYNGLGDLFVFIFFGLVGVNGTYYVNAGSFSLIAFISSAIIGLLVANILVVNNYRDYEEDKQSSKKTLVVRLGKKFGIVQYIFSLVASYILLIMLFLRTNNLFILLPFVLSPFGIGLVLQIFKLEGSNLNNTLSLTALFAFAFSILLSTGFVII
jgi:1,4-dihydroxy-2-naphthoate octaprenyltransferase